MSSCDKLGTSACRRTKRIITSGQPLLAWTGNICSALPTIVSWMSHVGHLSVTTAGYLLTRLLTPTPALVTLTEESMVMRRFCLPVCLAVIFLARALEMFAQPAFVNGLVIDSDSAQSSSGHTRSLPSLPPSDVRTAWRSDIDETIDAFIAASGCSCRPAWFRGRPDTRRLCQASGRHLRARSDVRTIHHACERPPAAVRRETAGSGHLLGAGGDAWRLLGDGGQRLWRERELSRFRAPPLPHRSGFPDRTGRIGHHNAR